MVQMSCYPTWVSTLCQRSSPFRCFPLGVLHPCRCVSVSDSSLLVYSWGWVGGIFAAPLGFLPCAVLSLRACAAFPAAGSLGVFRSPGVCPSASLVTWVGLQPFPSFSMLLLLRLLAGVGGVMHPVSGCSRCGGVCLV